jgi:hypothetical protein
MPCRAGIIGISGHAFRGVWILVVTSDSHDQEPCAGRR